MKYGISSKDYSKNNYYNPDESLTMEDYVEMVDIR